MVHVVICEKVRDHAQWLKAFNDGAANRKGSRGGVILQFEDDPRAHALV